MSREEETAKSKTSTSSQESVVSSTDTRGEETGSTDLPDGNSVHDILISNFNLDLLPGVRQDFNNVNWYKVSATTFFIGVYVVLAWAFSVSAVLLIDYLIGASTGFSMVRRVLTVVPIVFPTLGLFGIIARWSWRRMEDTPPPKNTVLGQFKRLSIGSSSTLFIVSILSIALALAFRAVIHSVSVELYGTGLSPSQVFSVVFLDGIYIGLLLIGFGGLISLSFTNEDSDDE
jgi:hypothetical protein